MAVGTKDFPASGPVPAPTLSMGPLNLIWDILKSINQGFKNWGLIGYSNAQSTRFLFETIRSHPTNKCNIKSAPRTGSQIKGSVSYFQKEWLLHGARTKVSFELYLAASISYFSYWSISDPLDPNTYYFFLQCEFLKDR